MNGDGVGGVVVTHNTFNDAIQAISNWRGSDWTITQNEIVDLRTRNGGGIGILVADYAGGLVAGNVVTHNKVSGTLHVSPTDGGGYSGTGIVMYADFRGGRAGADEIRNNRFTHNTVALESDTPSVVDVVAFELTDTSELGCDVIFDNSVGFNDFRGTANQIALTPASLDECNILSRNLGNNRGHGAYPGQIFTPGS